MNKAMHKLQTMANTPAKQRGMLTTFTGVMILVLLTLMMFFAIRVGVFEQRVSANDSRQKLAFHTAESGIHHAKEFLLANSVLIASAKEDFLANGSDGWLAETAEKRWLNAVMPAWTSANTAVTRASVKPSRASVLRATIIR